MKNLTIIFFFTVATLIHKTYATSNHVSNPNSIEFIRKSCSSTLHPALCFTSLSPYSSTINQNPLKLTEVALHLTFSHVKSLKSKVSSFFVSNLSSLSRSSMAESLHDCAQTLSDAADQTRRSMLELKKLELANGTEFRWCLSNMQTWMSSALTNEDTCVGLVQAHGSKDGFVMYVREKISVAEEYTSVALALVNKLADV